MMAQYPDAGEALMFTAADPGGDLKEKEIYVRCAAAKR
jgi:hypothetical protein